MHLYVFISLWLILLNEFWTSWSIFSCIICVCVPFPFMMPTMVLILNGSSEHSAHMWSKSGIIYLLKAFGYIERVVKSDFFFRKRSLLLYMCATCSDLPSYIMMPINTGMLSFLFRHRRKKAELCRTGEGNAF